MSVLNTTTAFGLTRNAGPSAVLNLAGTLTAPKIISLASTSTFNFTGGTLNVAGSLTSAVTVNGIFKGIGSTTGAMTFHAGSGLTVDPTHEFAANGANFSGSTTLAFSSALTAGNTCDVIDFGTATPWTLTGDSTYTGSAISGGFAGYADDTSYTAAHHNL